MPTFRTQSLGHIVNTCQLIAGRQLYGGDGGVGKTESAVALFTIKVNVLVVIMFMTIMAVAQFITHSVTTIFYDMYQVVFAKQRQCPEDA